MKTIEFKRDFYLAVGAALVCFVADNGNEAGQEHLEVAQEIAKNLNDLQFLASCEMVEVLLKGGET